MFLNKITEEEFRDLLPERINNRIPRRTSQTSYVQEYFYGHLGNFTVFVIRDSSGRIYAGVAKRNPCDKESNDTGLTIAATRAYKEFIGKDPGYCRQHRGQPRPEGMFPF